MKRINFLILVLILVPLVLAITNLDFRLDVEEKLYYPNDKIILNVTVVNRDVSFAAREAILTIQIGERFYDFGLGDLDSGETFQKNIELPQFPAGTHTIKGVINYTGFLDERFFEESYGSFEVLFPPIERYPRNVYVSNYDLPDKIETNKSYEAIITVTNDGEVNANILIEVGTLDEFETTEATLAPGESKTVKLNVNFQNSGVSLIEARAFAVINGEKYLLNYRGKKTFVQGEKKAKLLFDKLELVDEPDNQINNNDKVKIKIYVENEGDTATNVKGRLSSSLNMISILKGEVDYGVLVKEDSIARDNFEIESKEIEAKDYNLKLKLSYEDSEVREKELDIPLKVSGGSDFCSKNEECSENQACENNKCIEIECKGGYVKDRACIKYECIKDEDCKEIYSCDTKLYICKPPQCTIDLECEDNEVCSEGKCREAFTLVYVPVGYGSEKELFFKKSSMEFEEFKKVIPLKDSTRTHFIDPQLCKDIKCEDGCSDCQNAARECAERSGLSGFANKIIAISKDPLVTYWGDKKIGLCGCAAGIPSLTSISLDSDTCVQTVSHEVGHSMGLYHILCKGNEGGACLGPNLKDCEDQNLNTDIMSYCRPRTHYGPNAYIFLKNEVFSRYLGGKQ